MSKVYNLKIQQLQLSTAASFKRNTPSPTLPSNRLAVTRGRGEDCAKQTDARRAHHRARSATVKNNAAQTALRHTRTWHPDTQ